MKHSKLIFIAVFLVVVSTVQSLEYNKNLEPIFSIENNSLIQTTNFCFEDSGGTLCRSISDFKDDTRGITCDYTMFVRSIDVIHYQFRCELTKPKKICPLVLDLGGWPLKIVSDDFEINLGGDSLLVDKFPFVLSGNNRSLYFPINEGYEYHLSKPTEDYILEICSQEPKNIYESSIEIVAISTGLNKTNFHKNPSILLYENPPIVTIGPEETIGNIKIENFFTGRIFQWDPRLPYTNIAIEISPKNESYDKNETLIFKFKSLSDIKIEPAPYDDVRKKWIFPESGTIQVDFDYDSWYFPLSEYTTQIIVENNISIRGNQSLKIPNSELLNALVSFDKNEIKIEIFHNWSVYLLLVVSLVGFYGVLIYCFKEIRSKKRIPNPAYFLQLIPFIPALIGIIPLQSILFFILLLSPIIFWISYIYYKHKKS